MLGAWRDDQVDGWTNRGQRPEARGQRKAGRAGRMYQYPVAYVRQPDHPYWWHPDVVQLYGQPAWQRHHGRRHDMVYGGPRHHNQKQRSREELRSSSATLTSPPDVDYPWSRPTRRTQSSAYTLRTHPQNAYAVPRPCPTQPQCPAIDKHQHQHNNPRPPTLTHNSSFANRFFNDRQMMKPEEEARRHFINPDQHLHRQESQRHFEEFQQRFGDREDIRRKNFEFEDVQRKYSDREDRQKAYCDRPNSKNGYCDTDDTTNGYSDKDEAKITFSDSRQMDDVTYGHMGQTVFGHVEDQIYKHHGDEAHKSIIEATHRRVVEETKKHIGLNAQKYMGEQIRRCDADDSQRYTRDLPHARESKRHLVDEANAQTPEQGNPSANVRQELVKSSRHNLVRSNTQTLVKSNYNTLVKSNSNYKKATYENLVRPTHGNLVKSSSSFKTIKELLKVRNIQSNILDSEVIGRKMSSASQQSSESSCTCYQCQIKPDQAQLAKAWEQPCKKSAKSSQPFSAKSSLDINSNLILPATTVSSARRHLERAGTVQRLLLPEQMIKLRHFRRFLRSSAVSQFDFLLRVEELRRTREVEKVHEVDEDGLPAQNNRLTLDCCDEEFVALSAMLLCGDIELRPDTFQAITNKSEVRERLYGLVCSETDGLVTADQVMEQVAAVRAVRERSEMVEENLAWLERVFKRTVGATGEIGLNDFKTIVDSKNPFFVERVFQIFDKDDSGSISLQEFIDAMHQFAGQSPDDKIKFLFKVYDIDGDGMIQEAELQHVMRACMDENGITFDELSIEELTKALYQDATDRGQEGITFGALKSQFSKHEGLVENLSISIDRWLVPPKPTKSLCSLDHLVPHQFSLGYIKNNGSLLTCHLVFLIINLILFISRLFEFKHWRNVDTSRNWAIMVARAAGQCLNMTCVFVLLPMLRLSITKLRQKGVNLLLPLDKFTTFHEMTGRFIVVYSLLHTVAHCINLVVNLVVAPATFFELNGVLAPTHWSRDQVEDCGQETVTKDVINVTFPRDHVMYLAVTPSHVNGGRLCGARQFPMWQWLLTDRPGVFGLVPGCALWTGLLLLLILAVIIVCSMKWVRKSGYFEIFYWTHFLYIFFWIFLILHAPNFWKWFVGPACIFVAEKIIRMYNALSKKGKTWVTTGVILPSRVVDLVIKRPPNFTFKPGDYIYVNIPAIAQFEWHPFTVSSAPEDTDVLSIHIRAVGHWTNSLYQYFEKEQKRLELGDGQEPAASKLLRLRTTLAMAKERARRVSQGTRTYSVTGGNKPNLRKQSAKVFKPYTLHEEACTEKDDSVPMEAQMVARSFRYMRRKPTIISYKPPKDLKDDEDPCSSNHYILDRIKEKDGEEHLHQVVEDSRETITPAEVKVLNKPLDVYIDGPFGAPTSQIFWAQHAVLVGTGIGVTPFASILQSIMHRYWAARNTCPKCSYRWTNDLSASVMNLRKVDFFWINREQRSFEWFVNLLSQLEIEQAEQGGAMERFLDMHMYITSALQKTDMKAVGLQLALDLLHQKSKRDLITGLKTRTIAGRPNWDKVFKQISECKKGRVTVFFCGSPNLGKLLKLKCDEYGFDYRRENF